MSDMEKAMAWLEWAAGAGNQHKIIADELEQLRDVLSELLECGDLRGDTTLPSPPDDPVLWSARMQTAWDNARRAVKGDDDE